MNRLKIKGKIPVTYTVVVLLITILTLTLNMVNGRFGMADFEVYYRAAANFLHGKPVYGVLLEGGSGYYKYSPVTLYLFLPSTLLTFKTASVIHFLVLGFCFWYTFILIRDLAVRFFAGASEKAMNGLMLATFILVLLHYTRETYLGNVNIVLLMVICLALRLWFEGKTLPSGILLGTVILVKPYFMLLLLPALIRREWRLAACAAATAGAASLVPFLIPGWSQGAELYGGWFTTLLRHDDAFPGYTSIGYLVRKYLAGSFPAAMEYLLIALALALFGWLVMHHIRKEKKGSGTLTENRLFEWFLLLAMVPSLFRNDWVQFLYSAPLIFFILGKTFTERRFYVLPPLLVIFFFFSANSDDLLGRELSRTLMVSGFMAMSNLAVILVGLYLYRNRGKD